MDINVDGSINERVSLPNDPLGYLKINLKSIGSFSSFEKFTPLFRSPDYEGKKTIEFHSNGNHIYILPKTILVADVFINLPKLKTHRKAGVTLSMKNLVGIIGDKNCLPHYRKGSPSESGDEYPFDTIAKRLNSKLNFKLRKMGKFTWRISKAFGSILKKIDNFISKSKVEKNLMNITNGYW